MMKLNLTSALLCAALGLACSSKPTIEGDGGSQDDLSGDGVGLGDGGVPGIDDVPFFPDDPANCEPITCTEVDADCGLIADGCGDVVDCGSCAPGQACGVITHNTCTTLAELCIPISEEDACAGKECGAEGDGCGGSYECGACDEDEACGVKEAFQCGLIQHDNPDTCPAGIESCAAVDAECGLVGNGCGGLLDCDEEEGGCEAGELCGVSGPGQCGSIPACQPVDAAEACDGRCGVVSNGCGVEVDGGLIECPGCPAGQACGAGGELNVCGDATNACQALSAAAACADKECGVTSDGCSGSFECGTCEGAEVCRQNECAPLCEALSRAQACADKECGLVSDACGGSYDCGSCDDGEACGLSEAFQCDPIPPVECVPRTAAAGCAGRECGQVYDGCGVAPQNVLDCAAQNGGCEAEEYCGVQEPFQCDPLPTVACTEAESCEDLGWECGLAIDECGNLFDCEAEGLTCEPDTETCVGGIDTPTRCLTGIEGGPGSNCDVCDALVDCSAQSQPTTLVGRVITPGRNDSNTANQVGVPGAFVYIIRNNDADDLPDIATGIPSGGTNCDRCDQQELGPVLASTTTDALGEFTLAGNIPVDREFLLVVKIGKFRRAVHFTVPEDAACETTQVPHLQTRLPRTRTDGIGAHIPRVAISTGRVDAMECVFEKMGVAASEFALPGINAAAAPRVHMYQANGARMGTEASPEATADSELHGSLSRLSAYDLVVFGCEGATEDEQTDSNVREYVNRGGRLFASHFSYSWLYDNGNAAYNAATAYNTGMQSAASWVNSPSEPATGTGLVSIDRPRANPAKIQNFADWLVNESAATEVDGEYSFSITEPRDLATAVGTASEEFAYRELASGTSVQQFSFNTPYGAPETALCGRVAYSGFHVYAGGGAASFAEAVFPEHCSGDLTAQEKVLLYMLFDLTACVTTGGPEPPVCNPVTDCTGRCGNLADGCGGVLDCTCTDDLTCLAGGVCGVPECLKTTCAAEGATCGTLADGCGGQLNCGDCDPGQVCGLLAPNQCTGTCTPSAAEDACAGKCGFVSDGCGNVHECDDCSGTLSCVNSVCRDQACVPRDCPDNAECGVVSDGCDSFVECGDCELPDVCGGGGEPNRCGRPNCPALSCEDLEAECGFIGNGCGAAVDCGPCGPGQICGQSGNPNRCFGCDPATCEDLDAECGAVGDGCGGVEECGECPAGEVCGAQAPNKCGPPGKCSPLTCEAAEAECGLIGDGCGKAVDCGQCPADELCGVLTPFKCDPPPACTPNSCESAEAECGQLGDGCGGLIDCGPCGAGEGCGLVTPNQCTRFGDSR